MTFDYQVVAPQEVIQLTSVSKLDDENLFIRGQDFAWVDKVLINDLESPAVNVIDRNQLTAVVPSGVPIEDITDVKVLSSRLTTAERSLIRFYVSDLPAKCSGILKLMQLYIKLMLTTPGTDIFAPKLGGNLLGIVKESFSQSDSGGIISRFVVASDVVARQIVQIQSKQPRLSPSERLAGATVVSAKFNPKEGSLVVSVGLLSQAGQSATANLVM